MSGQWRQAAPNGEVHRPNSACNDNLCRPVAVIPFEDREQVERLIRLIDEAANRIDLVDANIEGPRRRNFMAALREFANPTPPRPDEPTGLGAVVEDDKGRLWVRTYGAASTPDYECWKQAGLITRHRWSDITAVRVLSEGVTA